MGENTLLRFKNAGAWIFGFWVGGLPFGLAFAGGVMLLYIAEDTSYFFLSLLVGVACSYYIYFLSRSRHPHFASGVFVSVIIDAILVGLSLIFLIFNIFYE